MAKLSFSAVDHQAGFMEGLMGQGIPISAGVDLARGETVTAKGTKGKATTQADFPIGFVAYDTGVYGKVAKGDVFRIVKEATVYMNEAKPAGTLIYASDTDGELSDVKGTVEYVVGVYINDDEGASTSTFAYLNFNFLGK